MEKKKFLFLMVMLFFKPVFANEKVTSKICYLEGKPPVDGISCISDGSNVIVTQCSGDPCVAKNSQVKWIDKSRCKDGLKSIRPTAKFSVDDIDYWIASTYYAKLFVPNGKAKLNDTVLIASNTDRDGKLQFKMIRKTSDGEEEVSNPFQSNLNFKNCPVVKDNSKTKGNTGQRNQKR